MQVLSAAIKTQLSVDQQKTAVVLQHTALDGLGSFRSVLEQRGYRLQIIEPFADNMSELDAGAADLVIVMGGAISVNDEARYPFITEELRFIERRLKSGKPMLGACLGGQMIAKASGARVYRNAQLEAGYLPITLTNEGQQSPLSELLTADNDGVTMHWHSDAFDLPAGSTRLAHSAITPNQAFALGDSVLGLQFHMEACPRTVGGWIVAYGNEMSRSKMSPDELRNQIARFGPSSSDAGARVLERWLGQLPLKTAAAAAP
jgi:GMP synthase (glutamine-hydrolysing)